MIEIYEEEKHYDMLAGWWAGHGWDAMNRELLKPLGIVHSHEGVHVSAGFIYPVAGCGLALLEWVVADPKAKPIAIMRSIRSLTEFARQWCSENDYGVMMTTCKQEGLAKMHERNGFSRTDESMIHLAMVVNEE